jgi:hypothetical protein
VEVRVAVADQQHAHERLELGAAARGDHRRGQREGAEHGEQQRPDPFAERARHGWAITSRQRGGTGGLPTTLDW